MKTAALALLLALPAHAADGGLEAVWATCPDAPLAEGVDGGWFLSEARARRVECRLAACRTYAEGLEEQGFADTRTVLVVGLVALGAGVALGVGLATLAGKPVR